MANDLRQFRPIFYAVLVLALGGYGVAIESTPHIFGGIVLAALYALLAWREPVVVIPGPAAALMALCTGLWCLLNLWHGIANPMLILSQWLFALLLITLYSRRENRAYGQMMAMTLILMIVGAANSASLLFAVILALYVPAVMYSCALFHLEIEATRATNMDRPHSTAPLSLGGRDRRILNRTARHITAIVCGFAVPTGILAFLFFPRVLIFRSYGPSAGTRSGPAMTGFSEQIAFDQIASISQNEDVVAHVTLSENGTPLPPVDMYLRGSALDIYTGRMSHDRQHGWQWIRAPEYGGSPEHYRLSPGKWQQLVQDEGARQIHQDVLLYPTGTSALFALNGIGSIRTESNSSIDYFPSDGALRIRELPGDVFRYQAISSGRPLVYDASGRAAALLPSRSGRVRLMASRIDSRISDYAKRPETSGFDVDGPFARQRDPDALAPTPLDEKIADAICRHLQSNFTYTLDLTDTSRDPAEDPFVQFLFRFKRGHCEYFSGAMALMCQSLGLKARVVVGFLVSASDYNQVGGYYVVRQSNAHSWVEVLTPDGWKTFDPTSGSMSAATRSRAMLEPVTDLFDYLQYKWASSVAVSGSPSTSVIGSVNSGISASVQQGSRLIDAVKQYLQSERIMRDSGHAVTAIVLVLASAGIIAHLANRRRLHRRAQRIGLGVLPARDRLRLARKLRFYDELLQLLARQNVTRPPTLTPREFAATLTFLPSAAYAHAGQIAETFYIVRYGGRDLSASEQHQIRHALAAVSTALAGHRDPG